MKRKRFMRLVMSCGVQRNEAAHIAAGVGASGSYEALFASIRPWLAFRTDYMTKENERGELNEKMGN